jgi:hypothetical protein
VSILDGLPSFADLQAAIYGLVEKLTVHVRFVSSAIRTSWKWMANAVGIIVISTNWP